MDKLAEINGVIKPVLLWDVVRRHGFRDAWAAAALLRAIARARLAPVSVNALVRQAAADGVAMSAVTAGRYLSALEKAFVVEALPNFYGVTKGKALPPKYVFGDTGILASYLASDDAALCENAVALELSRRYGEGLASDTKISQTCHGIGKLEKVMITCVTSDECFSQKALQKSRRKGC